MAIGIEGEPHDVASAMGPATASVDVGLTRPKATIGTQGPLDVEMPAKSTTDVDRSAGALARAKASTQTEAIAGRLCRSLSGRGGWHPARPVTFEDGIAAEPVTTHQRPGGPLPGWPSSSDR